jgi:hypothetical protein
MEQDFNSLFDPYCSLAHDPAESMDTNHLRDVHGHWSFESVSSRLRVEVGWLGNRITTSRGIRLSRVDTSGLN